MKKQLLSIFTLSVGVFAFGQIGLNTATPTATLDIAAKTVGTTTNVEGLLIPRVDRQKAQSMIAVPTSTMIYVNSFATGTQTGTAINIDSTGYYYYNGTVWTKLNPLTSSTNIYNADGTLTNNRIVTQGANTLRFNPTVINGFSVDGQTFSIDAANNRVGMGTTTPQRKVHINGTFQLTNELNVGGTATTAGSAGTTGQVLVSNGAGTAPSWDVTPEIDGVIGNEILNATAGGALTRSGAGTAASPYTLGISDGDITTAKIADNNVTYAKINTPFRNITTATDTLTATDEGGFIYVMSSTPVTITVPDTLPNAFHCVIIQQGTGQVTVAGPGLASARGLKTRAQNSAIGVIRKSPVYATVTGDAVN